MQSPTKPIAVENILKAYSGKPGACCCGCSGKYSYASANRTLGGEDRGYALENEDINDKELARIVRKLNGYLDQVEEADTYYALTLGKRLYIAYKMPEVALILGPRGVFALAV